jgi:hypothetical protein
VEAAPALAKRVDQESMKYPRGVQELSKQEIRDCATMTTVGRQRGRRPEYQRDQQET